MNAEILSVGTELLLGRITNTNAAYLAKGLAKLGINCYWQTVVGDNRGRMTEALRAALSRADIVIMTGGLGPTYDDVTKEVVADYFGLALELHPESLERLTKRFQVMNRPMTENNQKQAYRPAGATIFPNDRGTANGLAVEQDGKIVIMLPGPPVEMNALFDRQVQPYLMKYSNNTLHSHAIHFFGIGESQLEQDLHDEMLSLSNPTLATYTTRNEVMLQVTASAETQEEAEKLLLPMVEKIQKRYGSLIYGIDVGDLQTALVQELKAKHRTVATAESCTGGLVSERITQVSGASDVFGFGVTSYANQAKMALLGVSEATLAQHGAVSPETATEMARGIRLLSGADLGISVTGIAGPTGGTIEKPVGLVYVGISTSQGDEVTELRLARNDGGQREFIRFAASSHALHSALMALKNDILWKDGV